MDVGLGLGQGLGRQVTAAQVLNTIGSEMTVLGAQCSVDVATFSILVGT